MKIKFYSFILFLLAAALPFGLRAQVSYGGKPASFGLGLSEVDFPVAAMPAFDLKAMLAEDAVNNANKASIYRIGKKFDVNFGLDNAGSWTTLTNGDRIWRQGFSSVGAKSINIIFSEYNLPNGAALFIYSRDKSHVIGSFTAENNKETGILATMPVKGEDIIVEYYEPADVAGQGRLRAGFVTHAYRDIFGLAKSTTAFGESGSCNMNVNCPLADTVKTQKRGAAIILIGGQGFCSGSMINNTNNDGTPYFLTANHCSSGNDFAQWVICYNWESATCLNPTTSPSMAAQSTSGTALKARNAGSDFCLVQMLETPSRAYKVYMNGWDKSTTATSKGYCLHHPSGDIKKFSIFPAAARTSTMSGAQVWQVVWGSNTTTEPGSSGSPLFGANKLIIGQLFGGGASCTSLTSPDNFGKLSVSWNNSTDNAARLMPWLDPENVNPTTLQGIEFNCTSRPPAAYPVVENFNTVVAGTLPRSWSRIDTLNTANNGWKNQTANTGNGRAMRAINYNAPSGRSSLYLPTYNMDGKKRISLKFKYAYGRKDVSKSDSLAVYVSTSCTSPYELLWIKGGDDLNTHNGLVAAAYTPVAGDWATDSLMLDTNLYNNASYLSIMFVNIGAGGNNMWLDDVNLYSALGPFPAIAGLSGSNGTGCSGFTVKYKDRSVNWPTQWEWSFPGGTPEYSFERNPSVTYSTPGTYDVTLVASNGEGIDTITFPRYVTALPNTPAVLPLNNNFADAAAAAEWHQKATGTDSVWTLYTGAGSFGTSTSMRFGNYGNTARGARAYLISNNFNMAGAANNTAAFDYAYRYFNRTSTDSLAFAYSTDCGNTFNKLWQKGGAQLGTTRNASDSTLPFTGANGPAAGEWRTASVTLPAALMTATNVQFALVNTVESGQFIYVDNVRIARAFCTDAAIVPAATITACTGGRVDFSANTALTDTTWSWTGPRSFTGSNSSFAIDSVTLADTGRYYVSVSNAGCDGTPVPVHLIVTPRPAAPVYVTRYDSLLVVAPVAGAKYTWFTATGTVLSDTTFFIPDVVGFYVLRIELPGSGCSTDTRIVVTATAGLKKTDISVYPNPTDGIINVSVNSKTNAPVLVTITDVLGKTMLSRNFDNTGSAANYSLDMGSMPAGIYMVRIMQGQTTVLKSVSKAR
ncbi:MAG: choice-of-anchor J domain-containing protein [Bacteroidota bacterium]